MGANLGPLRVPRFAKTILSTSAASATGTPDMLEASGFNHWVFQLTGTFTNYSVAIYGTLDPNITVGQMPILNTNYAAPNAAGGAWFLLPAPSDQSGTGPVNNPLTTITQVLECKLPLAAVCAVATGNAQTGTVNVLAWACD